MTLRISKEYQCLSGTPGLKKKHVSVKSKRKRMYISSSMPEKKYQPEQENIVFLTTRLNNHSNHSNKSNRSCQSGRFNFSLSKDIKDISPMPKLNVKKKRMLNLFDADKLNTQRIFPTICKTNLRQQISIEQIQYTAPLIQRKIINPQETKKEIKQFLKQSNAEYLFEKNSTDKQSNQDDTIDKIFGTASKDMIIKRFRALNHNLLRPQKLYQGRKAQTKQPNSWRL